MPGYAQAKTTRNSGVRRRRREIEVSEEGGIASGHAADYLRRQCSRPPRTSLSAPTRPRIP